jgi:AraC family transcriptional regulator
MVSSGTAPRIVDHDPITVTGLRDRVPCVPGAPEFAGLWARFAPRMHTVPGRKDAAAYGLCLDGDGTHMTYVAGVETDAVADGGEFASIRIPAGRYAVFDHAGPLAGLPQTILSAQTALVAAGLSLAAAAGRPGMIEYYGADFDPRTGSGTVQLWFPLAGGA